MVSTHFTIVQGTPFQFLVRVNRKDENDNVVPMPLTNCVVRLQARERIYSTETLLDLSSTDGGITIEEEEGTFVVRMSSEETSALDWRRIPPTTRPVYQCEITPEDGDVIRVLKGTLTLDPEVVR